MITIATLLEALLSCRPIGLLWDSSLESHCDAEAIIVMTYIQGGEYSFKKIPYPERYYV